MLCNYVANQGDRNRVLDRCPWLYDNYLFVLKVFNGMTQSHLQDFSNEKFWIQMYNLPLGGMNRRIGAKIGGSIGSEVDANESNVA